MKINEFKSRIESVYRGKFNHSFIRCGAYKMLGNYIGIDCYLAENLKECPHNIAKNDIMQIGFIINLPGGWTQEDELPENLEIRCTGNAIKTKSEQKYLYCDYKRIAFRKTSGDAEKIIAAFGKFVDRLHKSIIDEYRAENLLPFDMELVKEKHYAA